MANASQALAFLSGVRDTAVQMRERLVFEIVARASRVQYCVQCGTVNEYLNVNALLFFAPERILGIATETFFIAPAVPPERS